MNAFDSIPLNAATLNLKTYLKAYFLIRPIKD